MPAPAPRHRAARPKRSDDAATASSRRNQDDCFQILRGWAGAGPSKPNSADVEIGATASMPGLHSPNLRGTPSLFAFRFIQRWMGEKRTQARHHKVEEPAHFERQEASPGMHEVDGHRFGLERGKNDLEFVILYRLRNLIGEHPCHADARDCCLNGGLGQVH